MDDLKCFTLLKTVFYLGYEFDNINGIMDVQVVKQMCLDAIKDIEIIEKELKEHELTKCVEYLLNNRNHNNDDTLQFLIDPRRNWDDS